MRNSTFSISPAILAIVAASILLGYVLNQIDWSVINDALATNMVHQCEPCNDNTVHTYIADETLYMTVDTADYTYKVYDVLGTSAGNITAVKWHADTCQIQTTNDGTVLVVGASIVGIK